MIGEKGSGEATERYPGGQRMSIPDATAAADMLTGFLKMEEGHIDWAEIQRSQIEQMGLENYLANQTQGASK